MLIEQKKTITVPCPTLSDKVNKAKHSAQFPFFAVPGLHTFSYSQLLLFYTIQSLWVGTIISW